MKKILLLANVVLLCGLAVNSAIAQYQTTPVNCPTNPYPTTCPQNNWATPYITTETGTTVSGILSPNTRYYVVLEAMPTVAPCATLVRVTLMDGATDWNGNPFDGTNFGGSDVPKTSSSAPFPGRPYKVRIGFKTPTLASGEFVEQVYVKYRMECSVAPGTGTLPAPGGGRVGSTQKQTLVP